MIIVPQGDEAKGLQTCTLEFVHGRQHFRHSVNRAFLGMEGDLDEITDGKRPLKFKQSAGNGNGLKSRALPLAAFDMDGSSDRSVQLNPGRTLVGMGLGEVCHKPNENMPQQGGPTSGYQSTCTRA
jgi:hypothetical protein